MFNLCQGRTTSVLVLDVTQVQHHQSSRLTLLVFSTTHSNLHIDQKVLLWFHSMINFFNMFAVSRQRSL